MIINVSEYLDASAKRTPEKVAFSDSSREISFSELRKEALCIATNLAKKGVKKEGVAVFMDKNVQTVASFFGALYSGNFYTSLDSQMPVDRIQKIISVLKPKAVITDAPHKETAKNFAGEDCEIIVYEDAVSGSFDESLVESVRSQSTDCDIAYILFTSGSTGSPKGVIISHKSLIDFTEWAAEEFGIDENIVFGNQTPLYFSMSILDVYQTVRNSCTAHIIPKEYFSLPAKLMELLSEKNVNTLFWVPSALAMPAAWNALGTPHLESLKNVFFGGEVMNVKYLNKWIKEYPNARYVNFYGPTEVTDTCTFYDVKRHFEADEALPMGKPCRNSRVLLLDEDDNIVSDGETGEVCVLGTGLSYGYYGDREKTNSAFVQNPLNKNYRELMYRTGDLAYTNIDGDLVYVCRKDFQIKHMGHRIELGEIEAAVSSFEAISQCACAYDEKKSKIVLFYSSGTETIERSELMEFLKSKVPEYMLPNKMVQMEKLPINLNGKIDRQQLKIIMGGGC